MLIVQNGYECAYEMRLFAEMFFGDDDSTEIFSDFKYSGGVIRVYTQINHGFKAYFYDLNFPFDAESHDERTRKKVFTVSCTRSLCRAALQAAYVSLPWGVMCGIRPAKNAGELIASGKTPDEVRKIFRNVYEVSAQKTELALKVAKNEERIIKSIPKNSVSLYIGIPFCPTRCLYCSFVSTDIRYSGKYMPMFVEKLMIEIDKTREIVEKAGVFIDNIYIGGGTPTTLVADDIDRVCRKLKDSFDLSRLREFTLEAGRPDTITAEKLLAAKCGGVDRISINPQSMNDVTLRRIGRCHTSKSVAESFKTARAAGIENINADLIAGLPGENFEMFKRSLEDVIKLDPEDITVHSLCVKRAADFNHNKSRHLTEAEEMNKMLDYTQRRMSETHREPYYMYRQKNSSGNLENVGYAKAGYMSTYNINIMEEKQTIIALGGGGSTKVVNGGRIERVFNFKDPIEYIKRFDEILKKKDETLRLMLSN